jgi:hypothetical protein
MIDRGKGKGSETTSGLTATARSTNPSRSIIADARIGAKSFLGKFR